MKQDIFRTLLSVEGEKASSETIKAFFDRLLPQTANCQNSSKSDLLQELEITAIFCDSVVE